MAGIGHNSGDVSAHPDVLNQTAQNQIRSLIERVERLVVEREEINEQIKEVFAEAKGNGFDVPILRKVVAIRKMDRAKRLEQEAVLDLYLSATGDIAGFEPRSQGGLEKATTPEVEDDSDLA